MHCRSVAGKKAWHHCASAAAKLPRWPSSWCKVAVPRRIDAACVGQFNFTRERHMQFKQILIAAALAATLGACSDNAQQAAQAAADKAKAAAEATKAAAQQTAAQAQAAAAQAQQAASQAKAGDMSGAAVSAQQAAASGQAAATSAERSEER